MVFIVNSPEGGVLQHPKHPPVSAPCLVYIAALWDPRQHGLIIDILENVQKYFSLKASTKNWKAGYDTLLKTYSVPTLEQRCHFLKLKLYFLYQIIYGHALFPGAPIEKRLPQRNLRNTASVLLQRPVVQCFNVFLVQLLLETNFLHECKM